MDFVDPGKHCAAVEHGARRVKEKARGTANGLPYLLFKLPLIPLVADVVFNHNLIAGRNATGGLCARQAFRGRVFSTRDTPAEFGAFAQMTKRPTDSSLRTRAGSAGSLTGSSIFFDLQTGRRKVSD